MQQNFKARPPCLTAEIQSGVLYIHMVNNIFA